jgi:DNA recombination protein RmuC
LLFLILFLRDSGGRGDLNTGSKIDQLTIKHDQFAVTSAQSTSTLRTELLAAQSTEFSNLRQEVVKSITQIGAQTHTTLEELRTSTNARLDKLTGDLTTQQASLKEAVDGTLSRLSRDIRDTVNELKKDVSDRIKEMAEQTTALKDSAELQQNTLRQTVEQRLDKLNEQNAKKLDEMRETVDEKLHKTLESRLTESFGIVTEHLGRVQTGLGEMKELASGVGDLKRLLTNVRTRGSVTEFQVGMLLQQMLAPNQFVRNAHIKPGVKEVVEFAVRIPSSDGSETLLPIDAKFPKEDWERLEEALSRDDKEAAKACRKALLSRIRTEAKKVSENYISPPATTDMAILCVGTEGLFAEVHREPGFVDELRSQFQIIVAGPTTLMAILSSLQMGFKALAIQSKSSEVRNLLAKTKTEFGKFGVLMTTVETQVGTVQNTLQKVGVRTRAINKTLSEVEVADLGPHSSTPLLDSIAEIGEESIGQPGVMLGGGDLDFDDDTK